MTLSEAVDNPQGFLHSLVERATRALSTPVAAARLTVERRRSLSDRLAGRPGAITEIRLATSRETLTLAYAPSSGYDASTHRESGRFVIEQRTLTLGVWLTRFADRLATVAGQAEGDTAVSVRALQNLGIHSPVGRIDVDETNLESDLQSLRGRVEGRLPADATAAVERITTLLLQTLPRVAGSGEPDVIARRTATIYLPDTLRAYLDIPAGWAHEHRFADGSTPETAVREQLAVLEAAVTRMHEAAVLSDSAAALLINGRFLADRFAVSSLDLDEHRSQPGSVVVGPGSSP
ncbi:MAG: hypothetical protein JWQ64_2206 [Subtercola sp.]|nr:hypothetical protein [Subtercola sp.]